MKRLFIIGVICLFGVDNVMTQRLLSLEDCRELAIQNNKELKIESEKVKKAGYDRKAAQTKYFPQLSATGIYMWNQKDLNLYDFSQLGAIGALIPSGIKDALHVDIQNIWIGDISLVQPVFMGGKIVSYNQLTQYAYQLAQSMNDLQLQEIIYHTDETYWQVVSLVHKKKLAETYVDLLKKMDKDVREMIQEGVATEADGLSVRVKLNDAEMTRVKVDNGLTLSRMLLMQICGLPLEEETVQLKDEFMEQLSVTSEPVVIDVNDAFMNRNEMKSLELATRIYEKKESIVLAEMLPNIALMANYLITNPNSHNGFKNEFSGMFNIGVMLQVPLSGWWEGSYKRNTARAETNIQRLQLENAREKIELQVNQSVYKVNEATKQLVATKQNMEMAEENLHHAMYGFEEGVIPILNLMEAQTAWLKANSSLIDSQIEKKLAEVYLIKALGGLTVKDEAK